MTNEPIQDGLARKRLIELGVSNPVQRDSRWTEGLQIPLSKYTAEALSWLSVESGGESESLAGVILERALGRAELAISNRIQRAKKHAPAAPAYYSQLIGALQRGYDEPRLVGCIAQLGVDDWRAIINDTANPGQQAIDVLAEIAGFENRGSFVAKLITLAGASPEILSAIQGQISQQRESVKFLDAVERAVT